MTTLETLNTEAFLFTETIGEWAILAADFGDGYGAAALVGTPEGTRSWSIRIDVIPGDETNGAILFPLGADPPAFLQLESGGFLLLESSGRLVLETATSRAAYLWKFFRLSKARGDQPFWIEIEDPDTGRRLLYLASFVDHQLSYQVLCARVYGTGLQLRQRRMPGLNSPLPV